VRLDLDKVRANVEKAETEDLLDRATVYRTGMEPEALELIEAELASRGVRADEIEAHSEARRQTSLTGPDGQAVKCWRCHRPAVAVGWGWHRLWGLLPVFPRWLAFCEEHRPAEPQHSEAEP